MSHRRALCVGVERFADPGLKPQPGAAHDARTTALVLVRQYGFAPEEVRVLIDAKATQRAFLDGLAWLLDSARPGDVRVLQVSAQASHVPDLDGDEDDGDDEVLVLYDHDWSTPLTDDRLAQHLARVPPGVQFAALWDTSYAGTLQDLRSAAYRSRSVARPVETPEWVEPGEVRYLDPPHRAEAAQSKSAPKRSGSGSRGRRRAEADGPAPPAADRVVVPAVSLAACADDETAATARFGGLRAGAFTWCLHDVLRKSSGDLTWAALHRQTAARMKALGFRQTPKLTAPPGGEDWPAFGGRAPRAVRSGATRVPAVPATPAAAVSPVSLGELDRRIAAHESAARWHEALACLWERVAATSSVGEKVKTLEHIASVYRVKLDDLAAVRHTAEVLLGVAPTHAAARAFLGR